VREKANFHTNSPKEERVGERERKGRGRRRKGDNDSTGSAYKSIKVEYRRITCQHWPASWTREKGGDGKERKRRERKGEKEKDSDIDIQTKTRQDKIKICTWKTCYFFFPISLYSPLTNFP